MIVNAETKHYEILQIEWCRPPNKTTLVYCACFQWCLLLWKYKCKNWTGSRILFSGKWVCAGARMRACVVSWLAVSGGSHHRPCAATCWQLGSCSSSSRGSADGPVLRLCFPKPQTLVHRQPMASEIQSQPQARKPCLLSKIEAFQDVVSSAVIIPKEDGVISVSDDR